MRNTLIILWLMCLPFLGQAQNKGSQNLLDSIHIEVKDIAQQLAKQQVDNVFSNTYKLYKTENIYIVYYFFLLSLHRNSTSGCGIRPSFH